MPPKAMMLKEVSTNQSCSLRAKVMLKEVSTETMMEEVVEVNSCPFSNTDLYSASTSRSTDRCLSLKQLHHNNIGSRTAQTHTSRYQKPQSTIDPPTALTSTCLNYRRSIEMSCRSARTSLVGYSTYPCHYPGL